MFQFFNFKVLIIALIATNLFACKKDSNPSPTPVNPLDGLVKRRIDSTSYTSPFPSVQVDTTYFEYDSIGRLIKISSTKALGLGTKVSKITYPSSTQILFEDDGIVSSRKVLLNADKSIDSTYDSRYSSSPTTKYFYSSNKLVKINNYNLGLWICNFVYDALGNCVNYSDNFGTINFTYSNISNTVNYGISFDYEIAFGPVKHELFPYFPNKLLTKSVSADTSNYYYTFDINNRVSSSVEVNKYISTKHIYTYY